MRVMGRLTPDGSYNHIQGYKYACKRERGGNPLGGMVKSCINFISGIGKPAYNYDHLQAHCAVFCVAAYRAAAIIWFFFCHIQIY